MRRLDRSKVSGALGALAFVVSWSLAARGQNVQPSRPYPEPPHESQGFGNIGITEVVLFGGLPFVIVFALGFFVGKTVGLKEGLRLSRGSQ